MNCKKWVNSIQTAGYIYGILFSGQYFKISITVQEGVFSTGNRALFEVTKLRLMTGKFWPTFGFLQPIMRRAQKKQKLRTTVHKLGFNPFFSSNPPKTFWVFLQNKDQKPVQLATIDQIGTFNSPFNVPFIC